MNINLDINKRCLCRVVTQQRPKRFGLRHTTFQRSDVTLFELPLVHAERAKFRLRENKKPRKLRRKSYYLADKEMVIRSPTYIIDNIET